MSSISRPLSSPPSIMISVLRCVSSAAPIIPVPGVAAAVEAVISILDLVELVRTSKQDCQSLAEKAAQRVLSLHTEVSNLDSNSASYMNIQANIEPFRMVLQDIQKYMSTLAKFSWVKQAWKRKEILEKIQELARSLEDCYQNFQITSSVRLQALITQLKDEDSSNFEKLHKELLAFRSATIESTENSSLLLTSEIQTVGSLIDQVEANRRSEAQKIYNLLKEVAVNTNGEPRHGSLKDEWIITLRELAPIHVYMSRTDNHAGITMAKYRNENVIVKRFHEGKKFLEEMDLWKSIWHPYLPQIIGHSSQLEKVPFIVLRGDITAKRDIRESIRTSIEKNTVIGLLNGLELLYGISSAINYLLTEDILTQKELLESIQPRNISLSSCNCVLMGEGLISLKASKRKVLECHRDAVMDAYLSSEFRSVCLEILVSKNRFIPLEVNSGQGPFSILRLLMGFTAMGRRSNTLTIGQVAARIERAWLRLNELRHNIGHLTFADIRRVFLSISDLTHSRTYTAREDWEISTGDVGYVRNGKFVCLENILTTSGLAADESEIYGITCDPPRAISKELMSNGWIRYQLSSPIYAGFWHDQRRDIADATALRYLIKMVPQYLEKYKEHDLALTDLILVTDTQILPRRWAEFSYHSLDDGNDNPPKKVYFFLMEGPNALPEKAWGYWSIDPKWVEMLAGSASNIADPQIECKTAEIKRTFEFVQLEKEDGEIIFTASANHLPS